MIKIMIPMPHVSSVYARVVDGKIAEYPVHEIHISNRAHPKEWYVPVIYSAQPETDEFHYLNEQLNVLPDQKSVLVTYSVEPYTLDSLFQRIPLPEGVEPELPGLLGDVRPTELPTPALVARIRQLVLERVQNRLDDFAATRGYSGILSACSYIGSTNPKFKAEAERCIELRDFTWTALYVYIDELDKGNEPLPYHYSLIEAKLPALNWSD